jgi:hypothetical protein
MKRNTAILALLIVACSGFQAASAVSAVRGLHLACAAGDQQQ